MRTRVSRWVDRGAPLLVFAGMYGGALAGPWYGAYLETGRWRDVLRDAAGQRWALAGQTLGVVLATLVAARAAGRALPRRPWLREHARESALLYALAAFGLAVFVSSGASRTGHLSGIGYWVAVNGAAAAAANAALLAGLRVTHARGAGPDVAAG
jgi:hypothetical protein